MYMAEGKLSLFPLYYLGIGAARGGGAWSRKTVWRLVTIPDGIYSFPLWYTKDKHMRHCWSMGGWGEDGVMLHVYLVARGLALILDSAGWMAG